MTDASPARSRSKFTRRDFVKTSAVAAAAGPFVVTAKARAARKFEPNIDTIRVGFIGCGGRGTGAAAQALRADENVMLTAMGDAFGDKINWSLGQLQKNEDIAPRINVADGDKYTGFDAYKNVIDSGVDMVILTTPPVFRPAHMKYAIDNGKHVFAEKPLAVDATGIRSVLATAAEAKKKNLALMSGFCWRHSDPQRETYGRILDGQIGDVVAMQSAYTTGILGDVARKDGWSDMEWQLRNWKAFTHLSGDHIVEQAIHAIDWFNWAMGDTPPVKCTTVGGRQCREGEWTGNMYDHFGVFYEWANGTRGYHMCRQIPNCSNDNTGFYMGTKGTCYSNPWGPRCIIEGENPWRWQGQRNDMYQTEHNELFTSIRDNEVINDGQWMCTSTMMGIMGRMAAYTGKTLTWEQCMNSKEDLTPKSWEWGEVPFPEIAYPGRTKFV